MSREIYSTNGKKFGEIYSTNGKKFADPCTGVIAGPVADALGGFYALPEEEQCRILQEHNEMKREKIEQHMADLKAARRRVRYRSPDLENLKTIADDLFAMCDDFVAKQKAKQKE